MCSKVKILDSEVILLRVDSCLHCLESHVYISWNINWRVCQWFKCLIEHYELKLKKWESSVWCLSLFDMMKSYVNLPLKLPMHDAPHICYFIWWNDVTLPPSAHGYWQLHIPCQSSAPFERCGREILSFPREVLLCFWFVVKTFLCLHYCYIFSFLAFTLLYLFN